MHFDTQKSIPRSRLKYSFLAAHNQKQQKKENPWHMHIRPHPLVFIRKKKNKEQKEQPSKTKIHVTQNARSYTS